MIRLMQALRLLHVCGLPLEDVDFINCDGAVMHKLLLEAKVSFLFVLCLKIQLLSFKSQNYPMLFWLLYNLTQESVFMFGNNHGYIIYIILILILIILSSTFDCDKEKGIIIITVLQNFQ